MEIPTVAEPLDASAFVDDPCALLDDTQRAELNLTIAKPVELTGSACDLFATEEDTLSVHIRVVERRGLAEEYENCDRPGLGCDGWITDTIDGYPVLRVTGGTVAKYGTCTLFLGLADDTSVWVIDNRLNQAADGPICDRADRVAAMVVATLK